MVIVLGGALLLASLPIMPLTFVGLPAVVSDLSHVTRVREFLFGRTASTERVQSSAVTGSVAGNQSNKAAPGAGISQEVLLETAAQDLLVKISSSPQDPALQNRVGLVYVALGQLDDAEQHFQRAIELARLGNANLEEKGQILRSQGNARSASAVILESSRLNIELSAAHSNLARVYEKLGKHDKVMAELDQLNKDGINLVGAPERGTTADQPVSPQVARLLAKGESLMRAGKLHEAMQEFRNVTAIDPEVALAHHQLGLAAALTNNPEIAVQELEVATRLDPADASSHNNLGLSYANTGEIEKAQTEFEKAIALSPRLSDAAINLGNLLSSQGRYGEASNAFAQAVISNPRSPTAHSSLATMLSLKGDHRQAIEEFRRALAINPNMAGTHYGLGLSLYESKSYMPAVAEFKRALALDPSLHSAQYKIEQAQRRASMATGGAFGFN